MRLRFFSAILILLNSLFGVMVNARASNGELELCSLQGMLLQAVGEHQPHSVNLHPAEVRSEWGKTSKIVLEIQAPYGNLSFRHHPKMNVYRGSLADKDPQLTAILDDMGFFQMHPDDFAAEFHRTKNSQVVKTPTDAEYLDFYSSRSTLLKNGFMRLKSKVKAISRVKSEMMEWAFRHRLDEIDRLIYKTGYEMNSPGAIERYRAYHSAARGFIGECQALIAMPEVEVVSTYLPNIPKIENVPMIGTQIEKKFKQLFNSNANGINVLKNLEKDYPTVIGSLIAKDPLAKPGAILSRAKNFMISKEMDYVRKGSNGKIIWGEVKYYHFQIQVADLMKTRPKLSSLVQDGETYFKTVESKSLLNQVKEDLEIIRFLGLSDKVELEYLANVSNDAKAVLESHGIRVIPNHE